MIHYTEFDIDGLIKDELEYADCKDEEEVNYQEEENYQDEEYGENQTFEDLIENIKYNIIIAFAIRFFCCMVYAFIINL